MKIPHIKADALKRMRHGHFNGLNAVKLAIAQLKFSCKSLLWEHFGICIGGAEKTNTFSFSRK